MRGSGSEIRVASAPEDTKMIIGGVDAKKSEVRSGVGNRLGWQAVEKVGGSGEGLSPVVRRKGSLKEQGARDIVRCAYHALSPTILRRRVGTRHTVVDATREEESTGRIVIELAVIVTLDASDGATELSGDPSEEMRQGGKSVQFLTKRKSPQIMREIMEYE
jgi:hypothetical protein